MKTTNTLQHKINKWQEHMKSKTQANTTKTYLITKTKLRTGTHEVKNTNKHKNITGTHEANNTSQHNQKHKLTQKTHNNRNA